MSFGKYLDYWHHDNQDNLDVGTISYDIIIDDYDSLYYNCQYIWL